MRSRLMVRFHLRQLNCRGFPLSVLNGNVHRASSVRATLISTPCQNRSHIFLLFLWKVFGEKYSKAGKRYAAACMKKFSGNETKTCSTGAKHFHRY